MYPACHNLLCNEGTMFALQINYIEVTIFIANTSMHFGNLKLKIKEKEFRYSTFHIIIIRFIPRHKSNR